ncbi:MAG: hypothetical protein OHK0022_04050 [Roseiflexaceae bacterium]
MVGLAGMCKGRAALLIAGLALGAHCMRHGCSPHISVKEQVCAEERLCHRNNQPHHDMSLRQKRALPSLL